MAHNVNDSTLLALSCFIKTLALDHIPFIIKKPSEKNFSTTDNKVDWPLSLVGQCSTAKPKVVSISVKDTIFVQGADVLVLRLGVV